MTQFTPYTIDIAPAGSCSILEKAEKAFGFVTDPQPHVAGSPKLLKRQVLTTKAA